MNSILPTLHRQKKFIIENAHILNKEVKISILSIVMMEIGKDVISPGIEEK